MRFLAPTFVLLVSCSADAPSRAPDAPDKRTSATSGTGALGTGSAGFDNAISNPAAGSGGTASNSGSVAGSSGLVPQPMCSGDVKTSVSGTIYDPAGKVPLYNVVVYVPSAALDPIADGVSCDKCDGRASGKPVSAALSDAQGKFKLEDVPAGSNIPLVIQVGKWRRDVKIPTVKACADTPITDVELTRLPRNQSEGHIPLMAVTTGHSDALECLLRKIGLDEKEFSTETGDGRVHMFVGCDGGNGFGANKFTPALGGAAFPAASTLWGDPAKLAKYNMLLFSCEGSQCGDAKKPYLANIKAYADKGGKLFFDHLHFYWLNHNDDAWQSSADYVGTGDDLPSPFTTKIDTTFPKGVAFADWLVNVGATPTRGIISILGGQFSVRKPHPPETQQWIYTDANPGDSSMLGVEYMTMNTPVELASTKPDEQCGRVVYTDLHVVSASSDVSHEDIPFPTGCVAAPLTPQEKALEFMFFDLSSCVQPEKMPPAPPVILD
jgi:hypothetical protein